MRRGGGVWLILIRNWNMYIQLDGATAPRIEEQQQPQWSLGNERTSFWPRIVIFRVNKNVDPCKKNGKSPHSSHFPIKKNVDPCKKNGKKSITFRKIRKVA
jgi:hypothetical protein